ncbi:PWWP domain containing protein, partial [Euroglyphus maynei]
IDSLSTDTIVKTPSKRGRKPKLFHSLVVNHKIQSSSKSTEKVKQTAKKWTEKSTSIAKRNKNELRCLTATSPLNKKAKLQSSSISPSNSKLNSLKYSKKQREIERERQLIKARRKLLMNEVTTPKHIPPVVATKSIPTKSILSSTLSKPSSSILNKVLKANSNNFMEFNSSDSFFSQNDNDKQHVSDGYSIKSEMSDNNNKADLIRNSTDHTSSQQEHKPPSSFLKPLNSEGETDEDRVTDNDCGNEQNTSQINETSKAHKNEDSHNIVDQNTVKQNNSASFDVDDDDDEEPYLYDDEQLEDHINYYLDQK